MTTDEKLRARRATLGLTQAEVATKAGMSTVQYNGYENARHEPSEATMKRLARALSVTPDQLWGDDSDDLTLPELKMAIRKKVASKLGVTPDEVTVTVSVC